jgi:hypothetical protein
MVEASRKKKTTNILVVLAILALLSVFTCFRSELFSAKHNTMFSMNYKSSGDNSNNNNNINNSPDDGDNNNNNNDNDDDDNGDHCEFILDKFDKTFNDKRNARQSRVLQGYQKLINPYEVEFWDLYESEATCFTEERFGKTSLLGNNKNKLLVTENAGYSTLKRYDSYGDGPKFICGVDVITATATATATTAKAKTKTDDDNCLVYSIGSNNNIDFEMSVSKFMNGCEIHTFDPTVKYNDFIGHNYSTYHEWGLGVDNTPMAFNQFKWTAKSFNTIIKELNHVGRTIDVLKIDCEQCEWLTMPDLFRDIASTGLKVNQIQIEMHRSSKNVENITSFFELVDKAKMRIFHKERNGWGCKGHICIEYAFISEDFLRKANKAAIC